MNKKVLFAAIAAMVLSFTACQKDEITLPGGNDTNPSTPLTPTRVKTTADLRNTDWTFSMTFADFLSKMLGLDSTCLQGIQNDTLVFGLTFDSAYAHFSFPDNIEAYGGEEGTLEQIYGVSYTYSYDGSTHTGYLDGVAEDNNGNDVPAKLKFTYNDITDAITFVLPMFYAEDNTPVNLTLVFKRNE
ncbi:MAG: hypothetical protein II525_03450 [Bacteroidales bacterium]|nr:hypothetical protein [Bacteroidales bacterium]